MVKYLLLRRFLLILNILLCRYKILDFLFSMLTQNYVCLFFLSRSWFRIEEIAFNDLCRNCVCGIFVWKLKGQKRPSCSSLYTCCYVVMDLTILRLSPKSNAPHAFYIAIYSTTSFLFTACGERLILITWP